MVKSDMDFRTLAVLVAQSDSWLWNTALLGSLSQLTLTNTLSALDPSVILGVVMVMLVVINWKTFFFLGKHPLKIDSFLIQKLKLRIRFRNDDERKKEKAHNYFSYFKLTHRCKVFSFGVTMRLIVLHATWHLPPMGLAVTQSVWGLRHGWKS